jgi:hypothetical protein
LLAAGNTNPQGIADPPATVASSSELQTLAAAVRHLPTDASVSSRRGDARIVRALESRWRERDQVLEDWKSAFEFDRFSSHQWCERASQGDDVASRESNGDSIATFDVAFESVFAVER